MMKKDYELAYSGKKPEREIISKTPIVNLEKIKDFGKFRPLNNWNNMLIFGDNLPVLKTLLSDPSIRGKIKL
ncbi:MAG: hypothetical protein J7L30_02060, partial [Methanophagales archaeon]|nr:hypothetical protein [Methanophagales archaeon]